MSIVGNTTMGDNVGGLDGNSGKHKVSEMWTKLFNY